jgi:hypothetical protein
MKTARTRGFFVPFVTPRYALPGMAARALSLYSESTLDVTIVSYAL